MLDETDYQSPRAVEGDLERRNDSRLGNRVDVEEFQKILGRTEAQRQVLREVRNFGRSPFNPGNERLWPVRLKGRGRAANSLANGEGRSARPATISKQNERLTSVIQRAKLAHEGAVRFRAREKCALKLYVKATNALQKARLTDAALPNLDPVVIAVLAWRLSAAGTRKRKRRAIVAMTAFNREGAELNEVDIPSGSDWSDGPENVPKWNREPLVSVQRRGSYVDFVGKLSATDDWSEPYGAGVEFKSRNTVRNEHYSVYGLTDPEDLTECRKLENRAENSFFFADETFAVLRAGASGRFWNDDPCPTKDLRARGLLPRAHNAKPRVAPRAKKAERELHDAHVRKWNFRQWLKNDRRRVLEKSAWFPPLHALSRGDHWAQSEVTAAHRRARESKKLPKLFALDSQVNDAWNHARRDRSAREPSQNIFDAHVRDWIFHVKCISAKPLWKPITDVARCGFIQFFGWRYQT